MFVPSIEILLHNARGVMIQLDNDSTFFPQALEKLLHLRHSLLTF